MPAVRHLSGIRSTGSSFFLVLITPVSTDDLNFRMNFQLVFEGFRGAFRQQIDWLVPLQITQNRAISLAATKRPIIHTQDAESC